MKISKLFKLARRQKGFSLHMLLPVLVVVTVAGVGTYMLSQSHAASTSYTGFLNAASVTNLNQGVFTTADEVNGLGQQTVADIQPNSKLVFNNFGGKVSISEICYFVRVYNSPKAAKQITSAKIQFVGEGSSRTTTLPADTNYHQVCVSSGSNKQLAYNIYNQSSSAFILVYQAVVTYSP